jgi:hypothetical protein
LQYIAHAPDFVHLGYKSEAVSAKFFNDQVNFGSVLHAEYTTGTFLGKVFGGGPILSLELSDIECCVTEISSSDDECQQCQPTSADGSAPPPSSTATERTP